MTKQERIKETVLQLKQIKAERELTCAEIHEMLIDAKEDLSLSSVKRVFADGSENGSFNFKKTLRPILRVMLSLKSETTDENRPSDTEIDTLKNVILLKGTMIDELTEANKKLESLLQAETERYHECHQNLIAFRDQIHSLNEQIKRKDDYINRLAVKLGL